jgi:HEAT repeat protein
MKRKPLLIFSICAAITGIAIWNLLPKPVPLFRGKPESEWIRNLKYFDDEQTKQWSAFGQEGVRVLMHGLQKADHPFARTYRHFYRAAQLPGFVRRALPEEHADLDRAPRMNMIALLSQLGTNADIAMPMVEKTLDDEHEGVRGLAISYFTDTEDDHGRLNRIPNSAKNRLLPKFVACMNSSDWGIRNNAIGALYYYRENKDKVVPILVNALADSQPRVRIRAAEALNHIAPESVVTAGVIPVAIQILNNPDDQIAYRGASLLGVARQQPELSVPALVKAIEGTNSLVRSAAAHALVKYDAPTDLIIPAFERSIQATNLSSRTKGQLQQRLSLLKQQQKPH